MIFKEIGDSEKLPVPVLLALPLVADGADYSRVLVGREHANRIWMTGLADESREGWMGGKARRGVIGLVVAHAATGRSRR